MESLEKAERERETLQNKGQSWVNIKTSLLQQIQGWSLPLAPLSLIMSGRTRDTTGTFQSLQGTLLIFPIHPNFSLALTFFILSPYILKEQGMICQMYEQILKMTK